MFRPIPLHDRDKFYQNKYVNTLVELSLNNLNNNLFLSIIHLIQSRNLKYVHKTIERYKSKFNEFQEIYNNIGVCLDGIYQDELNKDNLRGAFLELIVHEFLKRKYGSDPKYVGAVHCNVEIFGNVDYKTVDVFAFSSEMGFVSENKIGALYFEDHDIENLKRIYVDSNYYLKPYIITLATKSYIDGKLNELYLEDSTNVWVNGEELNIISADNIDSFFS